MSLAGLIQGEIGYIFGFGCSSLRTKRGYDLSNLSCKMSNLLFFESILNLKLLGVAKHFSCCYNCGWMPIFGEGRSQNLRSII